MRLEEALNYLPHGIGYVLNTYCARSEINSLKRRNNMSRLTSSQGNYLRTIYILSRRERGVRVTDIASHFGVTKASASIAVARLEKDGFVIKDPSRLVLLTPEGEREASRIFDSFNIISLFLTDKLKVDSSTASIIAGTLEHLMNEDTLDALRASLS